METLAEVPAIVPAIIILIGNLFSGHPGSRQWEVITALFCYATVISMMLLMIFLSLKYFCCERSRGT